jgi:hypothetical protein
MPLAHWAMSASDDCLAALEKQIDNLTTLVRDTKLTQGRNPSVPLQSTMPPARAYCRCHLSDGDDHLWHNCPFPCAGQDATSSLISGSAGWNEVTSDALLQVHEQQQPCKPCVVGKLHRTSHAQRPPQHVRVLHRVHMDLCDLPNGYAATIIDEATRYLCIEFLIRQARTSYRRSLQRL